MCAVLYRELQVSASIDPGVVCTAEPITRGKGSISGATVLCGLLRGGGCGRGAGCGCESHTECHVAIINSK